MLYAIALNDFDSVIALFCVILYQMAMDSHKQRIYNVGLVDTFFFNAIWHSIQV